MGNVIDFAPSKMTPLERFEELPRLRQFFTAYSCEAGSAEINYPFLTPKERDIETGLDHFGARYYGSTLGHSRRQLEH